jgi:outer membrane receptor for ferrienterochelin and colicin
VTRTTVVRALSALAALLVFLPVDATAQLQRTRLDGVVVGPSGAPIAAVVTITDPLGAELRRVESSADGVFDVADLAPGRYAIRAVAEGTLSAPVDVVVEDGLPLHVVVRLPPTFKDALVVEGARTLVPVASRASLGGDSLDRMPARVRSRGLQDALANLPGWATEDNGLLHSRGVDDGFLYVVDGVPVYERIDQTSGLAPDVSTLDGITVVTGYVPPEFGYKSGGVIEVRTRSAQSRWRGTSEASIARDDAVDGALSAGGSIGGAATLWVGGSGQRSDRFLDPVHPGNLHNSGGSFSAAAQLSTRFGAGDMLNVAANFGAATFDVPNAEAQEEDGQDQRQELDQGALAVSWQRSWKPELVSQVSAYVRHQSALLNPSPFDTPLTAEANRRLTRAGLIAGLTRQVESHLLKGGVEIQTLRLDERFVFAVTDQEDGEEAGISGPALEFTPDNPFRFADVARPTLFSAYLQDSLQVNAKWTVAAGVRFDRTRLLLARHQWSPRVGVAFAPSARTTLRASASRFYQPPQSENLLLSSSPEARALSPFVPDPEQLAASAAIYRSDVASGGAEIEPERQWSFEGGVEHRFAPGVRLDVAYWQRWMREVADPNVFFGTTIIFPNAVAEGRARGLDARLEFAPDGAWSGYANLGLGRTIQTGPITGGLFIEDDVGDIGPGVEFVPDHDQRVVAGGGITWLGRRGLTLTATARYESGTPIELDEDEADELAGRPGAEMVDFEAGRVKPRFLMSLAGHLPVWRGQRAVVQLRAAVLNLFDERFAYNFGNPFSGTHFGAPRTFTVGVRVETR